MEKEIELVWKSTLLTEFETLRTDTDPHRRGKRLEPTLKRLFQDAHFRVEYNPGGAKPRQTDLIATYGDIRYVIEAKWEKEPVSVDVLDGVRTRMRNLAPSGSVLGIIVSISGFTDTVLTDLSYRRDIGHILLLNEADLISVLKQPSDLVKLLRLKSDELVVHGRVHLATQTPARPRRHRVAADLPSSELKLLDVSDHSPRAYLSCRGTYCDLAFADYIPDMDWLSTGGGGVSLDLPITVLDPTLGVDDVLHVLYSSGWATGRARWNIQQAKRNWHGIGVRELLETLHAWNTRYEDLEQIHHTEEITYFDQCRGGGFYTLKAIISSDPSRVVRYCHLSFQLPGVPVEVEPIRHLQQQLDVATTQYFRPLTARAVT
ncbi:MAG: hypothetical protein EOO27_02880, partial [Comamonadaceae bacterium]